MKAILVIDVDEKEIGKKVNYISVNDGGMSYTIGTKNDVFLKPMPQKNEIKNEEEFMNVCGWMYEVQTGMDIGWNDCLDEIIGETE